MAKSARASPSRAGWTSGTRGVSRSQRERCKDLFDLDDDSPRRSAHDLLAVDAAARGEPRAHSLPRGFLGSSVLWNAPRHSRLELDHDRVLVVIVEGNRVSGLEPIVPDDDPVVFEDLGSTVARPGGLDAVWCGNGILFRAHELDQDRAPRYVARPLLHVDQPLSTGAHRARGVLLALARAPVGEGDADRSGNERHAHDIDAVLVHRSRLSLHPGHVPDDDALVLEDLRRSVPGEGRGVVL